MDGYHAIPLHKDSKHFTTFITPWGAYRYYRLPQGFVALADAYTRRYDDLIAKFPRKVKCIDDVLLWDNDIESSFFRAWDFLSFCAEHGIVLSKKKFKFCQDNIEFAGLQILRNGIAPSQKILQAIEEFPTPTSLTDARSWFGLINQVAWAHFDSATMTPFRELIKPNTPFYWDSNLESSFKKSKEHIINLVKHGVQTFDTSKPTCLLTDWSQQGIGFLLMQKHCECKVETKINPRCCKTGWKLTYAGSRFTSEAETRYSPTEGEALAVAWSLHKSKFFTLGCRKLTIATDHQPLLGLFKKQLDSITNPRLLRILAKTLMFTFDVVYTPGTANKGADAVSRNPVSKDTNLLVTDDIDEHVNDIPASMVARLTDEHNDSANNLYAPYTQLRDAIRSDTGYSKLQHLISDGFPLNKQDMPLDLQSFWSVKDRLTQTEEGIILMDRRVVIPANYRSAVLQVLHSAHQGVSSMKRRASECIYWPFMNRDLKNVRINCNYCNEIAPKHTKEPLVLTPDPDFPFQQVAADYFSVKGHNYLVLVDRYSGWFTISYFEPSMATSHNLIQECAALFSAYGAPEEFSSDGGPQFTAHEFQKFLADWSIRHRLSSAKYAQSNGRAEAAVKTAKRIISDYVTANEPVNQKLIAHAVLQHRNTP
ncbi:MAG: DDE-type integrase/transposase/recombinase, partial [Bacteroidota bacterium]